MAITTGLTIVAVACVTWILVGFIRHYALRGRMMDYPGARASHSSPTPRGGGAAIAVVLLAAGLLEGRRMADWALLAAMAGLLLVAVTGWLDDHKSLSVRPRLVAHLIAALLLIPLAGTVPVGFWGVSAVATLWWILWAVSAVNLVNFMDGIDGLVGAQFLLFGFHLLSLAGTSSGWLFAAAMCGGAVGFLIWNWAPARIFLGDAGSGSLGFAGVVGGMLVMRDGPGVVTTFLPLYPIFLDATGTLLARWRRGERITEAHRTHLYQRLVQSGWGHGQVALLYAAASLAGIAVTHVSGGTGVGLIALYAVGVLVVGMLLSRRIGTSSHSARGKS